MSEKTLDRLLAILIVALLATGVLSWRAGRPETVWLYTLHGLLAGLLLAASVVKLRRSLPRAVGQHRWRRLAVALPLAVATLLSLGAGFVWVAGGQLVELGPWTLLGWHALLGLAIVPIVLLHLLPKRWLLLRPRTVWPERHRDPSAIDSADGARSPRRSVSRRRVLAAGGLGIAAVGIWSVAGVLDLFSGRPRRFTGSRWLPAGGIPIPTTFFGEGVPSIDPTSWRLRVTGAVDRPVSYDLDALSRLGTGEVAAVLDCTGGWAMETTWQGIPMATILHAAGPRTGARTVEVRSVTGWGAGFSLEAARRTFVATGVAGQPLPAANGAPCRLVVPDRRGLDWVKWVDEIVVA